MLKRAFEFEPKNPVTAYAIGEALRRQSQEGGEHYQGLEGMDYRQLAEQAIVWFKRSIALNGWDSRSCTGLGWCLDWLDRPQEAAPYFKQAEALDPNNYFNLNKIGLHYVQLREYAAARPWFERSARLDWQGNDIAKSYIGIIDARLLENATNAAAAQATRGVP